MSGFVPEKRRTYFRKKSYVFFEKHVRVFLRTFTAVIRSKKELDYGRNHRYAVNNGKLIIEAWKLKIPILGVTHMIDDGPHLQGRVKADAFTIADGFEGRQ